MFYLFISAFHIWSSLRTIKHITSDTLTNHDTAKIFEYPPNSAHKITSEMVVFVCYVFKRERDREGGTASGVWCEQMSVDRKKEQTTAYTKNSNEKSFDI